MAPKHLRTIDIAKAVNVHVNTIRLYESFGFLSPIPRAANGYRIYTPMHLEQARLARLCLEWPYLGDKNLLIEMVKCGASGDANVRVERTFAESAIEFLERWAAGYLIDAPRQQVNIGEAARHLNVTVDMLRNWERDGLLSVPRDPANQYRLYGTAEFGRIRVIRTLVQAGYSLMAILRMFQQFDAGKTDNLRAALDLPDDDEEIQTIADRWLSTLIQQEARAQNIIRQISRMIELAHAR
jgi:DNA-binding transcriptional MerR regulator